MTQRLVNRNSKPEGGHVASSAPQLLTLPAEVRNMIYNLLFIHDGIFDTQHHNERPKLSAQFLRTCRQIYDEGFPILYGANTWVFEFENTAGPHHDVDGWPIPLEKTVEKILPHLRRIMIRVRFTDDHKVAPMRDAVRHLAEALTRAPKLEYVELGCDLHCDAEKQFFDFGEAYADSYVVRDGGEKEMFRALRTWLGQLHDIKQVVVHGLKDDEAEEIKTRLQGLEDPERKSLTDMYTALEERAERVGFPAESLKRALLAVEDDDMERFKERSSRAVAVWKNRVKEMEEGMYGLVGRWEQAKLR